jgi:hypothetical protein
MEAAVRDIGWGGGGVRIVTVPQRAQPALLLAVGLPRRGSSCTHTRTQHPLINFTATVAAYHSLVSPSRLHEKKGPSWLLNY